MRILKIIQMRFTENMELTEYFKELTKKTAHRFPKQIKPIYLRARALADQLFAAEEESGVDISVQTVIIAISSIAYYHAVIQLTGNQEKAYDIVGRTYEDYFMAKSEKMRESCRKALFSQLVPPITADFIKKNFSDKEGFKSVNKSKGMKLCHIDIVRCPFHHYCAKYDCEDLTTAFCDVADEAFNHLHRGVSWDRTRTLGKGDDKCDFIINVD